ncbi:GAF domain-containing sensor histidine kinase [Rhodoferax sp. BAB1]|uniref:GAF domain-containing sensor histidine kinase n=1 Tax=Rhodoferax sp. BAB1 TaxID=2741720 RepID=UPI001576D051|nr:ATP-binding protein [Rhodoferax sp. BAB1]QKO21197.1 GAF domain-containing protein [Rhodoferax sp. BAB1]
MLRLAPQAGGLSVEIAAVDAPPVASLLAEITSGLSQGRELETLLGQFLGPIVRLAGAQAGVVRILSEDGEHMRLVGDVGLPPEVRFAELLVDRHCGTCGVAADSDAPAWSADMSECARHHPSDARFYQDCQRMLAMPLRHRGRLLGLYNLFFCSEAELGADVQTVLRSIGELLGLALHNARLERETLASTVMTERKFLASEVHDSIAQSLAYVNMRLPLLQDAMQAHDDTLSQKYFADVEQAMGSIQCNLREILTNFRVAMDPQGLVHAVQVLATEFRQRAGIPLQLQCEVPELGLTSEQEVQVFHIVQEALANVGRHAQAQQAWLTLSHRGSHLDVRVEDDGRGVAALQADGRAHFGLDIMNERAQRLGGVVEIGPRVGGGTRVRLTVPFPTAHVGNA